MAQSAPKAGDTTGEARARMIDKFKSMTVAERAQLSVELTQMTTTLALAGIRAQHGDLDEEALRWHLAARRYGSSVAEEAFGPCPTS